VTPRFGRAVVIGAAGGFGRAFRALLTADGSVVCGVDTQPAPGVIIADATTPSPQLRAVTARADLLLLCLPERALFDALDPLLAALPPGALVVDTTSVKSRYAATAPELRADVELLSLAPMFAPDVGFAGQDVVAVPLRAGPRSARLRPLVEATGARWTEMTVEEHDRHAAASQVAVHAALLAYGAALQQLGGMRPGAPSTPVQRALCALVARVATRDPAVYWHIQRDNPYGPQARTAVRDALTELDAAATADDPAPFVELITKTAQALGPDLAALAENSATLTNPGSPPGGAGARL
jgi:4-amino-4-deoxyprephenate dehydrogenase